VFICSLNEHGFYVHTLAFSASKTTPALMPCEPVRLSVKPKDIMKVRDQSHFVRTLQQSINYVLRDDDLAQALKSQSLYMPTVMRTSDPVTSVCRQCVNHEDPGL